MSAPIDITTQVVTPILDSGVLPRVPRPRKPSTIRSILALIGGLIVFLPVIAWTDQSKHPANAFLLLVSALALTIIVHELGHLSAGWIVGFRFNAIHAGPFSLSLEYGRVRMRMRREMLGAGAVGMYVKTVRRLRRRMLFFVAGGPAANVISVPAAAVLINYLFPQVANAALGTLAAQFTVLSLITALANLAPIRSGILRSDGAIIEMLLLSREGCRRWLGIYAVANQYNEGLRPREWRSTWVNAAATGSDVSLEALIGNWFAYVCASDRKDRGSAAIHLERCLELTERMPTSISDLVAQEAAFFCAWFRRDASLSDKWLTQVKKPRLLQKLVQLRLKVARACARMDFETADLEWQKGFTFIETATSGSAQSNLKESWLEWQTEIREYQGQRSNPTSVST